MGGPLNGKAMVGARNARKGAAAAAAARAGDGSPSRMKRLLLDFSTGTSSSAESSIESATEGKEVTGGAMEAEAAAVPLDTSDVVVISIDGNIGAGKSTLLEAVRVAMPEVEVVVEPVAEWENLKTADGKSLLAHFYDDSKRWGYTFQNCAILTRIIALKNAIKKTKKRVIVTERSVMTDRYVFAEMNRDCGNIDELEWDLYMKWFDNFAADLPVKGVIHVTTDVNTSADRIVSRGREGEDGIPKDYLTSLDAQHYKWLDSTDLPVLRLSTEGTSLESNVERVKAFIAPFLAASSASDCADASANVSNCLNYAVGDTEAGAGAGAVVYVPGTAACALHTTTSPEMVRGGHTTHTTEHTHTTHHPGDTGHSTSDEGTL
jgi:deoxycitidine kinase/deoxyguanosine kinase